MKKLSNPFLFQGLNDEAVLSSRKEYGSNSVRSSRDTSAWKGLVSIVTEPMFILLLIAAGVYHFLGQLTEALYMLGAIILVSTISFFQDTRTRKALLSIQALTAPKAKLIRNNTVVEEPAAEIVVGDFVVVEEGTLIPADGRIVQANDFSVNESTLTGESFSVAKSVDQGENTVFQGTLVTSGLAVFEVTQVGSETALAKVQQRLKSIKEEKTPLQKQIDRFVKQMALAGAAAFVSIWVAGYIFYGGILESLLKALTLAMSILPEEIPVAFTTFMALGAWRMMRIGIVVKDTKTVEALGAATVICADKTGTITENRMQLIAIYVPSQEGSFAPAEWSVKPDTISTINYAMWASEVVPFDPMEKAIHEAYEKVMTKYERTEFRMVKEYPLSGKPPLMTHVFENAEGKRIVAAKGAPEAILNLAHLTQEEKDAAQNELKTLATKGYRVLGVGHSDFSGVDFPEDQHQFSFAFDGLVAFYDPPKSNIKMVFDQFYEAGINVKIITGDNTQTALEIVRQAGLKNYQDWMDGEHLSKLDDLELESKIEHITLFTRMFPEAKYRIIEALKKRGHIVAMTGDGVNDGPAMKAAHIGIAMGKRGSELAKQASSLVLLEDDLAGMVEAIKMGRRIYSNLKKAIQYIISIHIPIILTVTIPLIFDWHFPIIFSPVHIIFFELIMGPTCSIVYENEPIEPDIMKKPPRQASRTFFSGREIGTSIVQGLIITLGSLSVYQYATIKTNNAAAVCTMVFITLCFANIALTLVNRSFEKSIFESLKWPNKLLAGVLFISVALLIILLSSGATRQIFGFTGLTFGEVVVSLVVGLSSALWFEVYKYFKKRYRIPEAGSIN